MRIFTTPSVRAARSQRVPALSRLGVPFATVAQGTADCEECGAADAEMSADGRWLCVTCAASTDEGGDEGFHEVVTLADALAARSRGDDGRAEDAFTAPNAALTAADEGLAAAEEARAAADEELAAAEDVLAAAGLGLDAPPSEPMALVGLLVPGSAQQPLAVVIGGETWSWAELGQAIVETLLGGRPIELRLGSAGAESDLDDEYAPARPRFTEDDAVRAEAVALLADCLARTPRHPRPAEALIDAVTTIRKGVATDEPEWKLVRAGAGWGEALPAKDDDVWLDAAVCLAAPRYRLPLSAADVGVLASMELDDWIASVIELTRAGPGTPVDPQSLIVLAARCMDVDSGALEAQSAALMRMAFELIIPVWTAVGAVGPDGTLTPLGAWGLPLALARSWGGSLDEA